MSNEKRVVVQEVIALLNSGYTRWKKDETDEVKSIQSHYDLTFTEATQLFANPKLKNLKRKTSTLVIIDTDEIDEAVPTETTEILASTDPFAIKLS